MDDYRLLTDEEIGILEDNGCTAEDWTSINVADDFSPAYIRNVRFYGTVNLGVFEKNVEVTRGFARHSGLRNAILRNVTIGDNCLIENIGGCINNYSIGDECCICNVSLMETTAEATFGEGIIISVLNEAGNGNVMLFRGLTSNMAALMVSRSEDKEFVSAVRKAVRENINLRVPEIGTIGSNVRIMNTTEITNTNIDDNCEVNGACRLSDCTLAAEPGDGVYIGSGVICENSIIADGSSVLNSAKVFNCYVGESSQVTNGFTAENSLFFANTYMANGEACAAFCGPFSASHHKSSLLIGCMTSFYNAGSATNFSNHAYKMGPIHYGVLERGTKTASGSHTLLPATIGAFSVCIGKLSGHPDTHDLPFSYVIGDGRDTFVVPGKNIMTVGLYRDIRKWPRRDVRMNESKKSIVNYDWLSPFTVNGIMRGRGILQGLLEEGGEDALFYDYNGCKISNKSLRRGLKLYDMAVELFIGDVLMSHDFGDQNTAVGSGDWRDLSGLLLPAAEEDRIVEKVKYGIIDSVKAFSDVFTAYNDMYADYLWTYTLGVMKSYVGVDDLTESDFDDLRRRGVAAREAWLDGIRRDAEKEFGMGDVDRATLDNFLTQLS